MSDTPTLEEDGSVAGASRAKEESGCEPEGYVDIVFDGPPSHESGRFVEVENAQGSSINFGKWVHREDGYWALRIAPTSPHPVSVGEGWKSVPVEPDQRQIEAARSDYENLILMTEGEGAGVINWQIAFKAIYRAMLAASPASPPAGVGEKARTAIDGVLREFGVYWRERDETRRAEFIAAIAAALSPVQAAK